MGLTRSLNRALALATGEYLARMDADDICLPHRLAFQLSSLEDRPQVGVLGTNVQWIDEAGALLHQGRPQFAEAAAPQSMRWELLWDNPLPHMTVMLRRATLAGQGVRYDPSFYVAQDYDLWARLSTVTDIVRLAEVTVLRRYVSSSVSWRRREQQLALHQALMQRQLGRCLAQTPSILRPVYTVLAAMANGAGGGPYAVQAAASLVVQAYRAFLSRPLSPEEQGQIQRSAVRLLRQLQRWAAQQPETRSQAWAPLWALRHVSWRALGSRDTLGRLRQHGFPPR
ncbi:MAG: glycosyltransferase [Anaerolineae bacterium]|nr:glycosyltransferase [Anaerolineae bacterium]